MTNVEFRGRVIAYRLARVNQGSADHDGRKQTNQRQKDCCDSRRLKFGSLGCHD